MNETELIIHEVFDYTKHLIKLIGLETSMMRIS